MKKDIKFPFLDFLSHFDYSSPYIQAYDQAKAQELVPATNNLLTNLIIHSEEIPTQKPDQTFESDIIDIQFVFQKALAVTTSSIHPLKSFLDFLYHSTIKIIPVAKYQSYLLNNKIEKCALSHYCVTSSLYLNIAAQCLAAGCTVI
jgi:hypothetical protein